MKPIVRMKFNPKLYKGVDLGDKSAIEKTMNSMKSCESLWLDGYGHVYLLNVVGQLKYIADAMQKSKKEL